MPRTLRIATALTVGWALGLLVVGGSASSAITGLRFTRTALGTASSPKPQAADGVGLTQPNILVIKTDDQVYDSLTRMAAFMPTVAAFFQQQGREYTNSTVSSPSCCQSRAATFVGRYPHNEGVWSQGGGPALDTRGGIAPYLQRAGYYTAMVGKYLNLVWSSPPGYADWTTIHGGCANGSQTESCTTPGRPAWYYNFVATDATGSQVVPGDATTGANYNTTWAGSRFTEYLTKALADPLTPWYLEFDPTAPHTHDANLAYTMPEPRYRDLVVPGCQVPVEQDRTDKPAFVRAWPAQGAAFGYRTVCPVSQRTLKSVDDLFGQVTAQIAAAGQLENTLIVFTSDNGLMNGEHAMLRKFVAYEPSVRVPLLVSWPGHVVAGPDSRLVSNIDILPSLLEAAGITPDPTLPPMDGRSLLSTSGHTQLLSEYRYDPAYTPATPAPIPTWASMWDGRYKYIETYSDKAGTTLATTEYYDLQNDPGELTNLIGLIPGSYHGPIPVASLRRQLATLRRCRDTTGTSACP